MDIVICTPALVMEKLVAGVCIGNSGCWNCGSLRYPFANVGCLGGSYPGTSYILSGHSCSSGELDGLGLYGTIAVCSLGIGSDCTDGALHGACREMRKVCLLILRTMNGGASMVLGGGCLNGAFI